MNQHGGEKENWKARTEILLGKARMEKLAHAHVFVAGLGGVGGTAAEMLVRAGIGFLTIADGDLFETSNRNRQTGALVSTTGKKKTSVLAERFLDINPALKLTEIPEFLQGARLEEALTSKPFDCVLDAIDSLAPKVQLAQCCVTHGIPLVSCMGAGGKLRPELVRRSDLSESFQCPLACAVRKRLRKLGITGGYQVVFSTEKPLAATGSLSCVTAVFGCHCAAAVLEKIAGISGPAGKA